MKRASLALGVVAICCAVPGQAGATQVGTIFASPTSADPMVAYWNPAAMTLLSGTRVLGLAGFSPVILTYQRTTRSAFDGSAFPLAEMQRIRPEGSFAVVTDGGLERWRFGLSVTTPILDGAFWNPEYRGRPSSTRYYAIDAWQVFWYISFSAAYRINRILSIAVGLDVIGVWFRRSFMIDVAANINQLICQKTDAPCQSNAPLARENPAYQAHTLAEGIGWDVGVVFSALLEPWRWLRLGATFRSGAGDVSIPVDVDMEIPGAVEQYLQNVLPTASFAGIRATADFTQHSPITIIFGASLHPTPEVDIGADLHWVMKSKMSTMFGRIVEDSSGFLNDVVLVKDSRNDYYVGGRVTYRFISGFAAALRIEYNPSMRPELFVTPTSIDYDKIHLQLGLAWSIRPWVRVSAEYGHYFLFAHTVSTSRFGPVADPATKVEAGFDGPKPLGRYDGYANQLIGSLEFAL